MSYYTGIVVTFKFFMKNGKLQFITMPTIVVVILTLLITVNYGNCAKILGVLPMPSRSHYILGSSLMRALAEKGHDVTVISCFGEKDPPKNGTYRDIVATGLVEKVADIHKKENFSLFDREGANPFLVPVFMEIMLSKFINPLLEHQNIQELLRSKKKFDVVIIEQFMNDAQKAFATVFDAPMILFSAVGPNFWTNSLSGNPSPPSYISDVMLSYSNPMSFCERLTNSAVTVFRKLYHDLYRYPKQKDLIRKHIPNGPDLSDVLYNASLVFPNSHSSINQAVPLVPNMIEIGGFHVTPPKKLPDNLQKFLDEAKDGVIYFSMGSNIRSAQFPVEKRDAILKSFSKLKQKVLWKWEDDVLPGQPANVKLSKWLPQLDILAHPNIKLFITHGGFLSTTETIYHGVPVLAIPIFGDQQLNAKTAESGGYGLVLPYKEISEEKLTQKINEILTNPKYDNNVKKRSELFHDRMVRPMDTAIYWVEYVIRHKGAPNLRIAGLDLPWYKYHLLDLIGFLTVLVLVSTLLCCYLVKFVCKKIC